MIAQELLREKNIHARVLNFHSVKPLDTTEILKANAETKGIITIEEHSIVGGLGSAVAEICMDHSSYSTFFHRMGLDDEFSYVVGDQKHLRKVYGMSSDHIVNKSIELLK